MFGKMGGKRVAVESDRMTPLQQIVDSSVRGEQSEIGALASIDKKSAGIMVWNYHDLDKQGAAEPIQLSISGMPAKSVTLTHYTIDSEHSNSYEVWKKMGSPQNPTTAQIAQLEKAGQLETVGTPKQLKVNQGKLDVNISLPRQAVSLLKIEWK
jgi:xylan 1,4-beta-xylosidase